MKSKEKREETKERGEKIMKDKQKGITLIALVITIIVLLILAGVSIATLTGENGILNRAKEAREKTEIATEDEQRKIAMYEAAMNTETYEYETGETEKINDETIKKTVPIPAGFAPTGIAGESTIKEGFCITDDKGNEFVWVPCGENDSIKYSDVYYRYNR